MRTLLASLSLILLAAPLHADGFYDVVRENIVGPGAAPAEDTYETFSRELSSRQIRAARRDWEARPAQGSLSGGSADAWLAASIAAHRNAFVDAFAASMADRYRMRGFGLAPGGLLREPENWNAGTLASAALIGGAYAYFTGVRAAFDAGPLKVALDVSPGKCLRTLASAPASRRLARLELSERGIPLSLFAEWGLMQAADRVGANWSARF